MLEPLRQEKKLNETNDSKEKPLYRRPDVDLLDDRQWFYVQRRFRLSPRELQVAKHICRGFPNEEVAQRLRMCSGTVKTHLRNIYRRMHVTNKIGMLLAFVEQAGTVYGNSANRRELVAPDSQQQAESAGDSSEL